MQGSHRLPKEGIRYAVWEGVRVSIAGGCAAESFEHDAARPVIVAICSIYVHQCLFHIELNLAKLGERD